MIKAWAQLLRIPNVFTAIADVIAGGLLALGRWPEGDEVWTLVRVCLASACLYSAGMVLNDFFDVEEDTRERPFRPIPSERVRRGTAGRVGIGLMLIGLLVVWNWDFWLIRLGSINVALMLAGMIFGYDASFKQTSLGPAAMGSCRLLNFLLGAIQFTIFDMRILWAATLLGCYITGVTYFAKSEARQSKRFELLVGLTLICCAIGSLLIVAGDVQPCLVRPHEFELTILLAIIVGVYLLPAILKPVPARVQSAVRACIFGLIGLDSILAYAAVGPSGLLLLLLLIPSIILGKYVYST